MATTEQSESFPPGRYVVIAFVLLIALTAISYVVSFIDLGPAHSPAALLIAAIKAVIVAWAFMELTRASIPARIVVLITLSFIALLAGGAVTDVDLR